jgi:hypothetical protein
MEAEELEPPSCMEMAADLYHVCSVRWAGGSASCPEDCQASIADCIHDLEPEAQDVCGFDEACKSDYFEAREEWRAASEPLCLAGLKECPSCPE